MLISLIVPCYNEEEAMPLFYQEAARVAAQMEKSHGAEFEIIFVDDGSKDGTLRVARELHDADPRVRYVSFSRNFGKEAGIYAGLKAAKGDYVATLDADLQDPPALLPDMLDALLTGDYESKDIVPLMIEMWEFIRDFEGDVPGASARDCGNYLDMNLPMAKYLAKRYLENVLYDIKEERLVYPE